jgi:hypothetical protein
MQPISTIDHIIQYKQLTIDLAKEENLPNAEIQQLMENSYILALKNLVIEGSEEFEKATESRIKKICKLKAGRKLFEILNNQQQKIKCVEDEIFRYNFQSQTLHLQKKSKPSIYYNSFDENVVKISVKHKKYILMAHELIHAIHMQCSEPDLNCIKNMSDLEEQHTILGFNHKTFQKKISLEELDVLCENTFHLAINRPPRVDRQGGEHIEMPSNYLYNGSPSTEHYFKWIEKEIISISSINVNSNDRDFAIEYLKMHPNSFSAISEELKQDASFLAEYSKIIGFGDLFRIYPESKNNKIFMMNFLKQNSFDFSVIFKLPKELFDDKEFVLYSINNLDRGLKFFFHSKISETLKLDSDIIQALSKFQ